MSLVTQIEAMIRPLSPEIAQAWIEQFNAPDCHPDSIEMQHYINRFWHYHVGMIPGDRSIDVRGYLSDDIQISNWLNYFQSTVVPFIVEHQLLLRENTLRGAPPWTV